MIISLLFRYENSPDAQGWVESKVIETSPGKGNQKNPEKNPSYVHVSATGGVQTCGLSPPKLSALITWPHSHITCVWSVGRF